MARIAKYLGIAVLLLALAGAGIYAGVVWYARSGGPPAAGGSAPSASSEGDQKGILASVIEKVLSSPSMTVSVGAVDGALSSDAVIRDVVISDPQGPWLRLDRARLVWSRAALFTGRLLIDTLEIGHLEILRKPLPSSEAEKPAEASADSSSGGFSAPSLPIKVVVGAFSLAELDLGEGVIGVAAKLGAQGHATLGRPSDGLDLVFDLKRQDAPGAVGLQLAFDPKSTALKLGVQAHEPAGGLIAHAVNLDGLPPVDLDLKGEGPLDAFQSQLSFSAGPLASVAGGARLDRRGDARALTLDLDGAISKMLPPWLGPVFQGQTKVAGAALFGDDGSYGLDHFQIVAKEARLDASGRFGADQNVEGHVSLHSVGDESGAARAGDVEIGALEFLLDAKGPMLAPALDLKLHVADAKAPPGRIGKLDVKVTGRPDGPATEAKTRIDLAADASGEGLDFADRSLKDAIGEAFALTLRARAAPSGDADVSVASVKAGSGEVTANGLFGLHQLKGHVAFDAPDLRRFAGLAQTALAGSAKGGVDLAGNPSQGQIDAKLAIAAERFSTGIDAVDGLIGGKAKIAGGLGKSSEGFRFDGLHLATPNLTATLDGKASHAAADVTFSAEAADLSRVAKDFAGKAQAHGRVIGTLDHPDAVMTLAFSDVRSMGRAIPRLNLDIAGTDLIAAPSAKLVLDGVVDGKPAKGNLTFSRDAGQNWSFGADTLNIGSVALAGSGVLSAAKLLDGAFTLRAGDLDDLTPLALQKLAGRLDGKFSFSATDGGQSGAIQIKAAGLRAEKVSVERLDMDAKASDLFGAPRLDGVASIDKAVVAGETIPRLRLAAKSAGDGSDFSLSTEARGIQLESKGRVFAAKPLRVDLAAFEARGAGQKIALVSGPAHLTFPEGGIAIRGLALASGAGRLTLDGKAGETLDLNISAKALPLALAKLAAPDLALEGSLDAAARISGPAKAPTGDWRLDLAKLSAPQLRSAGIGALGLRASGRLQGGRTSIKADLSLPRNGSAQVDGFVPLDPTGAMDVAVRASVDAGLANTMLADSGRSVAGKLTIDARAQGSMQKPQLSGAAAFADGLFEDPLAGVRFDHINALLRARGDTVAIERFTAATRGGGSVAVSGNVRVAPDAGFPATLRITGQKAELVSNDFITAIAELALDISGPLARRPRVGGKVTFDSIDVRVPDNIPASSRPLEDTRHVQPTAAARARLALMAKARIARSKAAPAFNADINVAVSAPARIFVRGHGMDAELGGDIVLAGDLSAPVANGAFQLRRGAFTLAGRRLDFARGNINFVGSVIPNLDFLAQNTAGDVTAQIVISGPANQPDFAFTSVPGLPQDEVLSRLLFNSASGGLTPIQSLQLAQTVAEFSGRGGPGALEKMRRSLGVDSLDVQLGADGSPSVGASRYIMKNVNVGVRTGARPQDNAVTVGVDVWKHVRVQGETGADGSTSVGAGYQYEYDTR
jgi:translocation and assembly module TamB